MTVIGEEVLRQSEEGEAWADTQLSKFAREGVKATVREGFIRINPDGIGRFVLNASPPPETAEAYQRMQFEVGNDGIAHHPV